jgi:HEAT repeat protein
MNRSLFARLCCTLTLAAAPALAQWDDPELTDEQQIQQHVRTARDRSKESWERSSAIDSLSYLQGAREAALPLMIELLDDPDGNVALSASLALGTLMPDANRELPLLRELLGRPRESRSLAFAAERLSMADKLGPELVPLLEPLLGHPDPPVRAHAASALGKSGAAAAAALPALIRALDDDEWEVSSNASSTLMQVLRKPAEHVAVLHAALRDASRANGRKYAIDQLANAGAAAEPAVPELVAVLKGPAEPLPHRAGAAYALGMLGPRAAPATRELIRALGASEYELSSNASSALMQVVRQPEAILDVLIEALADRPNLPGRIYAAQQLASAKAKAAPAVPLLLEALQTAGEPQLQGAAAYALGQVGPAAESAVPALLGLLDHDQYEVADAASTALRLIVPKPARVLGVILEQLKDESNRPARIFAARWAGEIGPDAAAAVPLLAGALGDTGSPELRAAAAEALGRLGPAAGSSVEPLIRALDDVDAVASNARLALDAIVTRPDKVLDVLLRLMNEPANVPARVYAIGKLGEIGPDAAPAVPELEAALLAPQLEVRRAAAAAIGLIGPPAEASAPSLFALLDDVDGALAAQARDSLQRIVTRPGKLLELLVPAAGDASRPNTQLYAVETLVRVGPRARQALPALRDLAQRASGVLQLWAHRALGAVAPAQLLELVQPTSDWYRMHYPEFVAEPVQMLLAEGQYAELVESLGALAQGPAFAAAPGWVQAHATYHLAIGHAGAKDKAAALQWLEKAIGHGYDDIVAIHRSADLRLLYSEPRLQAAYAKIRVSPADLAEIPWLLSEILAVGHETSMYILENINREDPDFTEVVQVKLPLRETRSPTVLMLRAQLARKLEQQRELVLLSDQSRIMHQTSMGIIANMGSGALPDKPTRINFSRLLARKRADDRREVVRARMARLPADLPGEPSPPPPLGSFQGGP